MISQMASTGQIEPLIAIRDKRKTFLEVLEKWRKGKLNTLDLSHKAKAVPFSSVFDWLKSYDRIIVLGAAVDRDHWSTAAVSVAISPANRFTHPSAVNTSADWYPRTPPNPLFG